ncbi:hypothetical protein MFU01_66080 [Myxococcus fulvus]|uniref:Uncharacterized protein n=1 Tax=Myxococcus fulvus TaxID=33 RepID=A0A511TBK2_MYXFU|nr:hypothetical protein MFU01_66080 [Myxococcus fulvus]
MNWNVTTKAAPSPISVGHSAAIGGRVPSGAKSAAQAAAPITQANAIAELSARKNVSFLAEK